MGESGGRRRRPVPDERGAVLLSDVTLELIREGASEIDVRKRNRWGGKNDEHALTVFRRAVVPFAHDDDEVQTIVLDLTCSLQHLCRMLGIDWEELVAKSGRCNADEVAGVE